MIHKGAIRRRQKRKCRLGRQDITRDFEYCDSMGDLPGAQIRPYMLGDALAVWEAAQESAKEIQPWMPWCHDEYSVDESREWIAGG